MSILILVLHLSALPHSLLCVCRRKIDALKMIITYVYSVKHYLREEDSLEWDDYAGILPESFSRSYPHHHQSLCRSI